jgi:hypothetical protein
MKVRRAAEPDIRQVVELAEERRRRHQTYQPTLWRAFTECKVCSDRFFKG